ncbi:MAG TPA: hypothetical protein ENG48_09140 [Candidatus Atribacteria bacterium]|nr:hypothetical protein [Candidatus Atribacteria bacterium]
MSTYKGPKVTVRQNFQLSAADVAVENLPSAIAASAFYVGDKENIGRFDGVGDGEINYPYEYTIHDIVDWPREMFNFYPIKVHVKSDIGNIEITDDVGIDDTGISFDEFEDFEIISSLNPKNAKALFFKRDTTTVKVAEIEVADLTIIVLSSALSESEQANIVPGMPVGLRVKDDPITDWDVTAYVESLVDSTHIKIQAPGTAAEYDGILVGTYQLTQKWDQTVVTATAAPCLLYDIEANFTANDIKEGDIVKFTSPQNPLGADTYIEASIVQVLSSRMLIYNIINMGVGRIDYEKNAVKRFDQSVAIGMNITSYSIRRMVSFSENRGYKDINTAAGVPIGAVAGDGLSFSLDVTVILGDPNITDTPEEGDIAAFSTANVAAGDRVVDLDPLRKYKILSIAKNGNDWTITLNKKARQSDVIPETVIASGNFIHLFKPVVSHDVLLDYRAWNPTEAGVVQRISSVEKLKELYADSGTIYDENELPFMAISTLGATGNGVIYAINVDPRDLAVNYLDAMNKLKQVDCYSHAFGTTDGGVNALVPPYVDNQSDPERGHERCGTLTFSEWDVYLKRVGESTNVSIDGLVIITEAIPLPVGVRRGDKIYIIDQDNNKILAEGLLTATPAAITTVLNTDIVLEDALTGTYDYRISATDPNDQAIAISNLSYTNRRIKVCWPGWFQAEGRDGFKMFPPYYYTAYRVGMDSGQIASQAFTNLPYSIVGLKNITLNTNKGSFDGDALDIIGGGGIDIQVQETAVSQSIKSRHDLSTDMASIETRSWSIMKQVDVAAKTYRNACKPYTGRYNITTKFLQFLGEVCGIASSTLIRKKILRGASTAKVNQDPDVVDKINITIEISVFVANNRIDITLNVTTR